MKAILLGTQPKGRDVRLAKQMGSTLSPRCESFKPHSDKVIGPGKFYQCGKVGPFHSKGQGRES